MIACATHDASLARYRCAECGRLWCPACVEPVVVGEITAFRCACGAACAELDVDEGDAEDFLARLPGAFRYPATRRGLAMLAAGALYFTLAERIFLLPLVGQMFLFLGIAFGVSYLTALVLAVGGLLAVELVAGASLGAVGTALARFVALYLAAVEMRVLGLLYRAHRDELAWLEPPRAPYRSIS